jgi:LysM repeat protein
MKKLPLLIIAFIVCHSGIAQNSQVVKDYINTFREIAIEEMLRTGVPASITLAQGIHETSAGQSELVKKSNNHFGIKCKTDWKGESVSHDDDARGECFRKYDDPFQSYRDHSDFLKNRSHYASLFKLEATDYEGWSYGLKKAGYATNPKYPQILIKLIRDYDLQDYTLLAMERMKGNNNDPMVRTAVSINSETETEARAVQAVEIDAASYPEGVFKINNTKVIIIRKSTSYLKIAEENNITLARMFEFNDMKPLDIAEKDHILYLQRKRKSGASDEHVVTNGETLHYISQLQGIRLENLLEYNSLKGNELLPEGTKLSLKGPGPAIKLFGFLDKKSDNPVTPTASANKQEPPKEKIVYHTVLPKQTMYSIAKQYDVTVDDVMRWNDLSSTSLKEGQQIRIYKKNLNGIN